MHYTCLQWIFGGLAALLVGMTKTGIPGLGMLVVLFLAWAFGGSNSIGIMLPMLVFADAFAVLWYRRHAQWPILLRLLPWVLAGVAAGAGALYYLTKTPARLALMDVVIGGLVLVMAILNLLEGKLGDRMTPTSPAGTATTGTAAGFATTVSNAAGPIMTIFMAAQKISKEQFMGTIAWYFFVINLVKVPIYWAMNRFTAASLLIDLLSIPGILVGVYLGKWLLPRISQQAFIGVTVVIAIVGGIQLMVPHAWWVALQHLL